MGNLEMNECKKLIVAAYENVGGLELARAILAPPEPDPPQGSNSNSGPHWCVCSKCRLMPHPAENVCCRNRTCVTTMEVFRQVVLDPHVLAVCIVSHTLCRLTRLQCLQLQVGWVQAVDNVAVRISGQGQ